MRKIEEAMVQALRERRDFTRDNTSVYWGIDYMTDEAEARVYLHGNYIASYYPDMGDLYLPDAGWQTVTTKSRLNALLQGLCATVNGTPHIHQRDWE